MTRRFLQELLARQVDPDGSVGALLEVLGDVPEMRVSLVKPEVWIGDVENAVGRVTVAIAGGTNGGYPVFRTYYAAGVKTILAMHIDEADFLRLRAEVPADCNFIVTGHMPSDSIGINRLIWGLEDRGLVCTRTSGIIGVPRPASA